MPCIWKRSIGSNAKYDDWDVPTSLDLSTPTIHSISVETKSCWKNEVEQIFPYKWTATINGYTYSLVFNVPDEEYTDFNPEFRYVTANGEKIENAWVTMFSFDNKLKTYSLLLNQTNENVNNALNKAT